MPTDTVLESIANWTFPGLGLYYRDTPLTAEQLAAYRVGSYLRNNFFLDISAFSEGVIGDTRYVIASSKAAPLYQFNDAEPNLRRWMLHVLNANSYFKVLDIYERDGKTQILLLHIPRKWAETLPQGKVNFDLEKEVIERARQNFDEKAANQPSPELLDDGWRSRVELPVGLDATGKPFDLQWSSAVTTIPLYQAIEKIVNDSTGLN